VICGYIDNLNNYFEWLVICSLKYHFEEAQSLLLLSGKTVSLKDCSSGVELSMSSDWPKPSQFSLQLRRGQAVTLTLVRFFNFLISVLSCLSSSDNQFLNEIRVCEISLWLVHKYLRCFEEFYSVFFIVRLYQASNFQSCSVKIL